MKCKSRFFGGVGVAALVVAAPRLGVAGERFPDAPIPAPVPAPTHGAAAPASPPPPAATPSPAASPQPPADASSTKEQAPEPIDTRIHVDALLGIGSDHLNLGLGLRGGKTLDNHIYLGGAFVYHVGTSASATVEGMTITSSVSGFYLGPEIGYDIAVTTPAPLVVRPYVGVGLSDASASSSVGTSASSSELSIWPGVACHYQLTGSKYELGGDLRFVTGPWGTSFGVFVLGGMHIGS